MKLHIAAWQVILVAVLALTSSGMGGEPPAQTKDAASAAQDRDTTFIDIPVPDAPKLVLPPGSSKLVAALPAASGAAAAVALSSDYRMEQSPASAWEFSLAQGMGLSSASVWEFSSVQGMEHSPASALEPSSVYGVGLSPAPAVENQSVFRFAVISDIHVEAWNKESHTKLRKALTDLSQNVPGQVLVINGDLGNGLPRDYETLGKLMRELPYPGKVVYTIGNHEFYKAWTDAAGKWNEADFPNGETPEASIGRFLQFTGYDRVYHDSWIEGYHFIFLGSEAYRQTDDSFAEDAWLSEEQLQWLEGAMAEGAENGKPIFVFLHQPLPYTVAGSFTDFNSRAVIQHERLKEILSRYPQTVFFSGHSHWELGSPGTLIRDGFTMVNTSSVQSPYDTSDTPIPAEERKSEGLVVEVSGNKVHIRGRDFTAADWIPAASYTVEP